MKNKFNKARQEATDAITEQEEVKKDTKENYPDKFNNFVDFAREQGIEDAAIFDAINKAMVADSPEQKAKNRKTTKGAFGGKKQKSQK